MQNPIPLLTDLYRRAKANKGSKRYYLNDSDYETITIILKNRNYRQFNGQSVSNLLLILVYGKSMWRILEEKRLALLLEPV